MKPILSGPVLVVDDEPHIRRYVGLILRQLGAAQVWEAGEGESALRLLEGGSPELIVLDINMPGGSGLEILREMKTRQPDCPVIILTSLGSRFVIEEALQCGASGYIRKDTPRAEIARLIAGVFEDDSLPAEADA